MTYPVFPSLAEAAWPVTKTPTFSTNSLIAASGREVFNQRYYYPIWEFEVPYEVLTDQTSFDGVTPQSYQELLGFYLTVQSLASPFLYNDPNDFQASLQPLFNPNTQGFTGDGTTVAFTLTHSIGSYSMPVGQVQASGIAIYVNGTLASPSSYSITGPSTVTFTSPPASGATLTGSYTFSFVCRFTDDKPNFSNIMKGLWSQGGLKFHSINP